MSWTTGISCGWHDPLSPHIAGLQGIRAAHPRFGALAAYPDQRNDYQTRGLVKARSISQEECKPWPIGYGRSASQGLFNHGWVPRYNMNYYMIGNEIDIEPVSAYDSSPVGILDSGYGFIEARLLSFCARSTSIQHWSMDLSFSLSAPPMRATATMVDSGCDASLAEIGVDSTSTRPRLSGWHRHTACWNNRTCAMQPITGVEAVRAFS